MEQEMAAVAASVRASSTKAAAQPRRGRSMASVDRLSGVVDSLAALHVHPNPVHPYTCSLGLQISVSVLRFRVTAGVQRMCVKRAFVKRLCVKQVKRFGAGGGGARFFDVLYTVALHTVATHSRFTNACFTHTRHQVKRFGAGGTALASLTRAYPKVNNPSAQSLRALNTSPPRNRCTFL